MFDKVTAQLSLASRWKTWLEVFVLSFLASLTRLLRSGCGQACLFIAPGNMKTIIVNLRIDQHAQSLLLGCGGFCHGRERDASQSSTEIGVGLFVQSVLRIRLRPRRTSCLFIRNIEFCVPCTRSVCIEVSCSCFLGLVSGS